MGAGEYKMDDIYRINKAYKKDISKNICIYSVKGKNLPHPGTFGKR